jgi:hypothetical protein
LEDVHSDQWGLGAEESLQVEDAWSDLGGAETTLLGADTAGVSTALETVQRWLSFLKHEANREASHFLADASGYPLEHALELFTEELRRGASTVVTMQLPDGVSHALGPVGLVASVRTGEDLDLSLLGGGEWETVHLDFMATNPVLGWASEMWSFDGFVSDEHLEKLREAHQTAREGGAEMLHRLLASAARAGRAVTVAPLNDQLKEHYRRLGFQEDSLLDPTIMFWVPTEEVLERLQTGGGRFLAYGQR